jgi:hypothetical protein
MTPLNYCRLGKELLWHGAEARVTVAIDPPRGQSFLERPMPIRLRLTPDDEDATPDTVFELQPRYFRNDGRHLFAFSTAQIRPGNYITDVTIAEDEPIQIPSGLTVVAHDTYERLMDDEVQEPFINDLVIHGSETAATFIGTIISQSIEADAFERDNGAKFPRGRPQFPEYFFSLTDPSSWNVYPASKLRWTSEVLLAEFRNLAVFGLATGSLGANVAPNQVSFVIRGTLLEPLEAAVVSDLHHERFGLAARLRAARDLVLSAPPSIKVADGSLDFELGIIYSTAPLSA